MADDGMLLNFELPADAFAPQTTFKGGRWKDRLIARKSAAWGRKRAHEQAQASLNPSVDSVANGQVEPTVSDNLPSKRQRVEESGRSSAATRSRAPRDARDHPASTEAKSGQREVISSLFTFNPASKSEKPEPGDEDETNVTPSNAPLDDDLANFTKLGLSSILAGHLLKKLDVKNPTAIQRRAILQLCTKDTDAFLQAQTGSGKTLAYLLPIVQRISEISKQTKTAGLGFNRESGLFSIILAPTRELSKQISAVLESLLSCYPWIVAGSVIGGEKKKSEKARLRKGLNILVATPGRLADHIDNTEVLDVSRVRWLVLDEGDRLMELGFENDIQKLVSILNLRAAKRQSTVLPGLPIRRTTVLCSATIYADVDKLRSIALKEAVSISVDAAEDTQGSIDKAQQQSFSAPAQLRQSYAIVPPKQRLVTLAAVLKQAFKRRGSIMKAIVFISCADSVDFHFDLFTHGGSRVKQAGDSQGGTTASPSSTTPSQKAAPSTAKRIPQGLTVSEHRTSGPATAFASQENPTHIYRLHGSLPQAIRTSTLKAFSSSTEPAVLVCTDVASRGLDLPNIDLVVEYDPPFSKDDHLHRIGRTARAGKDGRALIFLQPGCEEGYIEILKDTRPRDLNRHDADELLKKGFSSAKTDVKTQRTWEDEATDWQLDVERWVLEHPKHLEQARRAFQSHIRAYATHVAAERGMFDMKQLHLGHLAKAFALRDKPGEIRVPGLRPGKVIGARSRGSRRAEAGTKSASDGHDDAPKAGADMYVADAEQDARRKMQAKVKALVGGASEFNLG